MANSKKLQTIETPSQELYKPSVHRKRLFLGFAPPTSNTTYTPNQFFDVCLPYYSRRVVRLVAYMIRRTLGWCDADGNPQEDQLVISYSELVKNAGISRGAIAGAIDQAIKGHFIVCLRKGHPKTAGRDAISALYELKWDNGDQYIKDPILFQGFYEGEGNRTDIPNQFFDEIIPFEAFCVIKVVGSIVRFSIGFQAKRGRRRQQVAMSFNDIQRYAKIGSRQDLSQAIHTALKENYIICLQKGIFTPHAEAQLSTTYALKWLDKRLLPNIGSKSVPAEETSIGSKNVPDNQSKIRTRDGSKNVPGERSKIRTSLQTKQTNETIKQQQVATGDPRAVPVNTNTIHLLTTQGFSLKDAKLLAQKFPPQRIRNQLNWLERRNPHRNRLGMLRRSIEENWAPPLGEESPESQASLGYTFATHFYAGLAGNQDVPTAEPSRKEVATCERYVGKILKMWPEENLVAEWGAAFGNLLAEEAVKKPNLTVTLTFALRIYGDKFYKQLNLQRVAMVRERVDRAREAHKKTHWKAYLHFLRSEEDRIRTEEADRYAAFEEQRAEARAIIERNRFITDEKERARQLRIFDSENERFKALLEFFSDVYDFWQWDKQINPEGFNKAKVAV